MRAVDTNVLVRMIVRDDPKQAAAADAFVSAGAWASHLVLAEAVRVLSSVYAFNSASIAATVEMLLRHEHVVFENPDTIAAALAIYRKRPALKFTDCLILEIARKAGHLPLATFDRPFGRLDGAQAL